MATNNAVNIGIVPGGGLTYTFPAQTDTLVGITDLKNSMSRQALMNSNFDIWQRGTTFTPADVTVTYSADRWYDYLSKDGGTLPTLSRTRQTLTAGDIPNSYYYTRLNANGAGTSLGTNSYHNLVQKIEYGTRYLCGLNKTVTVSFYARSSVANKKIGVDLNQNYGSGGTPTAQEAIVGTNWTLTSSWVKYSYTFTTNTLVGKTFGTANDDALYVRIAYMWGATAASRFNAGSAETYVGSGDTDIAQVQVNAGSVELPFQPYDYESELQKCMRYALVASAGANQNVAWGWATSTTTALVFLKLQTRMRAVPTIASVTASNYQLADGVAAGVALTALAISTLHSTADVVAFDCTVASGLTQYRGYQLLVGGAGTNSLILAAEV